MKCIKVPEDNPLMLEEFCNRSMFTFEGLDIESYEGRKGLVEFEKEARKAGYEKDEMIAYWFKGSFMNESYGLTDENAYPDDLTFVVVPDLYNPMFKLACGARWFDDIVASNSIRQNALKSGLEPDFS